MIKIHCSICKEMVELPHGHSTEIGEPEKKHDTQMLMDFMDADNKVIKQICRTYEAKYGEPSLAIDEAHELGIAEGMRLQREAFRRKLEKAEADFEQSRRGVIYQAMSDQKKEYTEKVFYALRAFIIEQFLND